MTRVDVIYALHLKPGDLFAGLVSQDAPTTPVQPFAAAHLIRDAETYTGDDGAKWMRLNKVHGLGTLTPVKAAQQVLVIRTR